MNCASFILLRNYKTGLSGGDILDLLVINYKDLMLVILMVVLIIKNYRKTYPEILPLKMVWKWVLCFILPAFVWLTQMGISLFITDHFTGALAVVLNFIAIYISTTPLFVVVIFMIKWRRKIDILWYCLLFALIYTFILECVMLGELSSAF